MHGALIFALLQNEQHMAILEKIRRRSGLAVGLIGFALALFVISDALNSNYGIFGGKGANKNNVGEIDGEQIGIKQFESKVDENATMYKERAQQKNLDQNTMDMVREQTWNQLVQEGIMAKEFAELGVKVTNDELFDMIQGENIHPQIKTAPIFQNQQTGQFDRELVIRFLKNITSSTDEKAKGQWLSFEDGLAKEAETKKYNTLLKKGVYATSLEATYRFNDRKKSADLEIVSLPYFSIADSTIKSDESELKSYFKKNSDKYKEKENSRKLTFVLFDVIPTHEDTMSINKWVSDQVTQFAASKNDTLYVDLNSDTKFDTVAKPRSAFPEEVQARLFNDSVGSIVGPIYNNGKFSIYKISGVKQDSVYQMHASHILFKTENGDTAASVKKANEVMNEIKKGASFAEKAAQFGTDGTSSRGGDLGWFKEGQMVKPFNDAVYKGTKGDMFILKTQFGVHIVKITDNKIKKLVCAGVLDRTITASEKTVNGIYGKASQFTASSQSVEDFDKNITEKNYTKRTADNIRENDKSVAGLPDAREVVRWAYNAKKDDVSDVFSIGDKYIVAVLAQIKEKDKSNFEDVKEKVEAEYRKDKKAEMLIEKANAAITGSSKLQDVGTKLKIPVTPLAGQNFENTNIAYIGPDQTFVGTLMGTTATNKILGPVKGDNAVYVYSVTKINVAPKVDDINLYKNEIQQQLSQKAESNSFEVLKDLYKVKDNRFMFY